jgi:hypothetical protein
VSLAGARRREGLCGLWLAVLAALVPAAAPAAGAACRAPWLALDAAVEESRWQETGSAGRRLVSERGTLRGVSLSLGMRCDGFDGLVRVLRASGSRDYDGVTSANAPIRTRSDVEQSGVELKALSRWAQTGRAGAVPR